MLGPSVSLATAKMSHPFWTPERPGMLSCGTSSVDILHGTQNQLGPVRGHVWLLFVLTLFPHTPLSALLLAVPPPSVPSNLLSTWAPEAMSAPPVVHTTHEPPIGTSCGRFPLRTREFLPHQTWPWAQCPVFCGNLVLCAVLPITSFVLILQLNPRL